MNRKLTALLTLVLLNATAWAAGQDDSTVTLTRISDRLYELTGGRGANGGLYVGDKGLLLIDAKMSEASVREVQSLLESRFPGKPLLYVVSTHSDGDHVTGNRYLPASATFVAHENCRREFFHATRTGAQSDWHNADLAPYVPEVTFRTRMDLYLGDRKVELWYFGIGHTTGDTVVYFPEEKTAFLGDQIFLARVQLIHSYKGGNSFEHVKTLRKMLDTLDADKFCSGHSEMTDRRAIEKHILQMQARQAKVTTLVEQGRTLEETTAAFTKEETRLVTSIYAEVTARP